MEDAGEVEEEVRAVLQSWSTHVIETNMRDAVNKTNMRDESFKLICEPQSWYVRGHGL